ncbi:MAG: ferredoxin reductase [Burkholderiales bacterium]|nr:ferredoxin reductase [Burkholderiales bacterium]
MFDFWVGKLNPAWSWDRPLARVVERRVEALDTVTLVLKPNGHCTGFVPGQHLNVTAEVNGRRTTRSYSLIDVPRRDGRVAITVKRVAHGTLSTHLCQHLRVGDVLELGPAFGAMTLPAQPQGPWLFLAAGSGITPLMSLTRSLAKQGMPVDLTVIYWAKTRAELCFARELRQLAVKFPRFKLQFVLEKEAQLLAGEEAGLISHEQLVRIVGDLSSQQTYACGPAGFVDAARALTAGKVRSFLAEGFTPSAPLSVADAETATVHVHLARSGRDLEIPTNLSILDALEAQGLKPKVGCRMGVCHTCVCTRTSGTTLDMQTGEQDAQPDMDVRICMSRARTDLSLDL